MKANQRFQKLLDVVKSQETALQNLNNRLALQHLSNLETQGLLIALAAALGNQQGVDRPRLSEDVRTTLRMLTFDPDKPSDTMRPFLSVLVPPFDPSDCPLSEKLAREVAANANNDSAEARAFIARATRDPRTLNPTLPENRAP